MILVESILGGICISIASFIYLQVGGGVLGAFLFSIGLLLILNMRFKLFTGTIGYLDSCSHLAADAIILIGNMIGSLVSIYIPEDLAYDVVSQKLSMPLLTVFYKALICGALIYVAVYCFKNEKVYMVPVCVAAFILYGAEHCIADFCFMVAANTYSIPFFETVVLGNSIGAILLHRIEGVIIHDK